MATQGHGYCSPPRAGPDIFIEGTPVMMRPLFDATREALLSLWRAMRVRREPEPPASGTGGAIG